MYLRNLMASAMTVTIIPMITIRRRGSMLPSIAPSIIDVGVSLLVLLLLFSYGSSKRNNHKLMCPSQRWIQKHREGGHR